MRTGLPSTATRPSASMNRASSSLSNNGLTLTERKPFYFLQVPRLFKDCVQHRQRRIA